MVNFRIMKRQKEVNKMINTNSCIFVRHPDTGQIVGIKGYCRKRDLQQHFNDIQALLGEVPPETEGGEE